MTMNDEQLRLARHALGLPNESKRSYRNRFVCRDDAQAGKGPFHEWTDLVSKGLAERHEFQRVGARVSYCFVLTRAGAEAALAKRETLCPEDFPPEPEASPATAAA